MSDPTSGLMVESLRAGYGSRPVLHGVSFTVPQGGSVLLLGANGAGKSTTLGAIIGSVSRFGGTVAFEGNTVESLDVASVIRLGMALVPEGGRVFSTLSVEENLRLGAYPTDAGVSEATLQPVFDLFPRLAERRRQQAGTLSGGERQMLAIGRALMAEPRMLLLDEPFLGLAPVVVNDVVDALRHINMNLGIGLLVVEQNLRAVELVDEAHVLSLGEIISSTDRPRDLLKQDAQAVQEGFLG